MNFINANGGNFGYKMMKSNKLYLLLGRIKNRYKNRYNAKLPTQEIFTEIYEKHKWGIGSGIGSNSPPYINMMINFLKSVGKKTIVDLGCGDFGVGENFIDYCSEYIAIDIVPELINKLQSRYMEKHIKFLCLDIVEDNLPDGDICLIRQVFQHLSNIEIIKVLSKLKKYETIFITEHQPDICAIPNKDMVHGNGIRLFDNSGVYLNEPPFNVQNLELVLEVPGVVKIMDMKYTIGAIRTYKISYKNRRKYE